MPDFGPDIEDVSHKPSKLVQAAEIGRPMEAYAELGRWRASPQVSNVRVRVSHNALGPGRWGPAAKLLRMRIGTR